jgi:aconitate hydratase
MGVLPLEFEAGQGREALGLTGEETFAISGISDGVTPGKTLTVTTDGGKTFRVKARIDTPQEVEYYLNGGILQYVLRQLAAEV